MFDFLEDAVDNVLEIGSGLLEGELPSRRKVSKLINDGMSVYAISEATGFAVDVIENLMDD